MLLSLYDLVGLWNVENNHINAIQFFFFYFQDEKLLDAECYFTLLFETHASQKYIVANFKSKPHRWRSRRWGTSIEYDIWKALE